MTNRDKQAIKQVGLWVLLILIIFFSYINWFISPINLGGDFNFVSYDHFNQYSERPYVWDSELNNGLGQYVLFTLPFFYYTFLVRPLTTTLSNPFLLHKIVYLIPLLVISFISTLSLSRRLLTHNIARSLMVGLFMLNPYFVMLSSGGQIGVAFAYGFAPFVLNTFLRCIHERATYKDFLVAGIALSILIAFDSRMALLTSVVIIAVYLGHFLMNANKKQTIIRFILLACIVINIVIGIHAYWLFPAFFVQLFELPRGYGTAESANFFSFARLAHALTWSHPNYPDNIFGKVNEVHGWEFIFPLFAFVALRTKRKAALFFSGIGLIAAFLIKGTTPPLGNIYTNFFRFIPTGSWFRDSTKFFLPLSLSYAVLIAISIESILNTKTVNNSKLSPWYEKYHTPIKILLITSFGILTFISWYPTFSHKINGTLAFKTYPKEFEDVREILQKNSDYGRVLWVPQREMYGYTDLNHPAISLKELIHYPNCLAQLCQKMPEIKKPTDFNRAVLSDEIVRETVWLTKLSAPETLASLGVNYIILTPDIERSSYKYDNKFDPTLRDEYHTILNNITYIEKIYEKSDLTVWKIKQQNYFITDENNSPLKYQTDNPTQIRINWKGGSGELKIAQAFDPRWSLKDSKNFFESRAGINNGQTIFKVNSLSPTILTFSFTPQTSSDIGLIYSLSCIVILSGTLIFLYKKEKKQQIV